MSYEVRFAPAAADDLNQLVEFLAENDVNASARARLAISEALKLLSLFPLVVAKRPQTSRFCSDWSSALDTMCTSHCLRSKTRLW